LGGTQQHSDSADEAPAVLPSGAGGGWRSYEQPAALKAEGATDVNGVLQLPTTRAADSEAGEDAAAPPTTAESEAAAAAALAAAAHAVRVAAERGPQRAEWEEALGAFEAEMRAVNKLIDSYNLSVPASWMAVQRVNASKELHRALHEAPQRAHELQAKKRGGGLARTPDSHGHTPSLLLGGAPPAFALHEGPTFPSVFDALRSAFFSRQ